jgi:hypothetical protein
LPTGTSRSEAGVKSAHQPCSAKGSCLAPQADREWQQNWEFPLATESDPASINFDELVKSPKSPFSVIPAKAGIQFVRALTKCLDPGAYLLSRPLALPFSIRSGGFFGFKPDFLSRWFRRSHELADGLKNNPELIIVFHFHFFQLPQKLFVGGHHPTQSYERSHDKNIHFNGPSAVQNGGQHCHALFGEG